MTKKAMKEQEKMQAAAISAEADKIKNLLIQKMQEEIKLEMYNAERQYRDDSEKASLRRVQLENSWYLIYDKKKSFMDYVLEDKEEEEWFQYLTCDGLPDPRDLRDLNTYMFLWNLEDDKANMTTVARKCEVVTYLLARLDDIINFSIGNESKYIPEYKTIRQLFREKLQNWLDLASYRLLRQIEKEMNREDLRNARYVNEANEMICCIWALIRLPVTMKQISERDRKNIEIFFQELDLTVKMPIDVDCYCMAIRALWLQYDHYSDQGTSFKMPDLPEGYQTNIDLLSYCQKEYEEKLRIREDQAGDRRLRLEEKKIELEKLMNPPLVVPLKPEKKMKTSKKTPPPVIPRIRKPESELESEPLPYLPTPEEVILLREDETRKEMRKLLFTRCEKTEVNLRKYAILGGVYHIDLVHQPPQPKDMRRNIFLTTLQLPKALKFVPFSKPYKAPPPAPDSERTPEVIEAEMKALEAAMEALALITLKLPDTVLWFEPPLVAHWIPEKKNWSTEDVHDIKYNEEKQSITFRTGRLGIHGLAAYRFINFPYQSWEMKPETSRNIQPSRGIILSITAAIIQVEFIVREDLVCLHTLIGGASTALQELVGQFMKLHSLIRKMRAGGCDLFPERDAFSYIKGLPVKHTITEKHLQACMGLLSAAYSFSWSRWNCTVTPRNIVIQSKELHGCVAKERTNMMLLVTPLQTSAVRCTEVSPEFSDQPIEEHESKFFADVYHLALHSAGIKSRLLMKTVSFKLASTVSSLLEATNVISMSS
ncbi:dynein axonemal intermediate chain 7 homolog [Venturia canescens]|uniref:dynein axonemal intermediate chain 7 homolog n=1 Tax=Venturia canescens TaxID=32260 RepID=UPI001C9CA229|nr:dynein axonemal intermediate chain 7 homolog [Venturia canescens]